MSDKYMQNRWYSLSNELGILRPYAVFDCIVALYNFPFREYHNLNHIEKTLLEFDKLKHLSHQPLLVELAIWFHDCVSYKDSDDEIRSASICDALCNLVFSKYCITFDLILKTRHDSELLSIDQKIIADADLSIWGSDPETYDQYSQQIREEYKGFDDSIFKAGRIDVLNSFMNRNTIFSTEKFIDLYENQARENIKREIESLSE